MTKAPLLQWKLATKRELGLWDYVLLRNQSCSGGEQTLVTWNGYPDYPVIIGGG